MPDPTAEPPPVQTPRRAEARASAPRCAECEAPVAGAYCASCGQKTGALRQPVHHFVRDSVSEFFGLDGRVWRTSAALLFKPGTLTRAHHAGQRQRFLSPLRVYLTSTLLFFFLLSLIDPIGQVRDGLIGDSGRADSLTVAAMVAQTDSSLAINSDSLVAARVARTRVQLDSTLRAARAEVSIATGADPVDAAEVAQDRRERIAEAEQDAWDADAEARADRRRWRLERAILATMPPDSLVYADDVRGAARMVYPDSARIFSTGGDWRAFKGSALRGVVGARTEQERADNGVAFLKAAVGYVPTVLFLILPIFALLLKLLYARRGWFYSEHVVFGLHTHAYAFVVFAAVTVVAWGGSDGTWTWAIVTALAVSIPVYFLVAQKRVYGQSWRKTILKALLLGTAYNGVLIAGIVGAILLAATLG